MFSIYGTTTIITSLDGYGFKPRNEDVKHAIDSNEAAIRRALAEIIGRTARLVEMLDDPEHAASAIGDITSGAGASGPIGSQWERIVAAAGKIESAMNYGMEHAS